MRKRAFAAPDAALCRVLFLCSGNYHYSRVCEELFNQHVTKRHLNWQAVSRALRPAPPRLYAESMSPGAVEFLGRRGIPAANHLRLPLEVTEFDFKTTDLAVAVNEAEHRPLVAERWPGFSGSIEYWRLENSDLRSPDAALIELEEHVDRLMTELANLRESFVA